MFFFFRSNRFKNSCIFNFAFQVQIEVIQKRQKEKKAMMNAVKKYQKGNIFVHVIF